jgi:hypothetical protein
MRHVSLGVGVFAVVLIILWRRRIRVDSTPLPRWVDFGEVAVLLALTGNVLAAAYENVTDPAPFDFPVFYTVGRAAWEGVSFYDPTNLLEVFMAVQTESSVPGDWLVEVGFWYAPPTGLLFMPLGGLGFTAALVVHYLVQFGLLGLAIVLLHRWWPLQAGRMGLIEMAILTLAFRPVVRAVQLGQDVFGALLFLVVAMGIELTRPWRAGIALGIGAVFKHVLMIPGALLTLLRRWKMGAGAAAAALASAVLAGTVFGFDIFSDFARFGPSDRSANLALDPGIYSLNGVLRRLFNDIPSAPGALEAILYPPYLITAGLVAVATLVVAGKVINQEDNRSMTFALVVVASLLIYPNTLENTLPLLIPAFVVVAYRMADLPVPAGLTASLIAVAYGGYIARVIPGFLLMILLWLFLAVCLAIIAYRSRRDLSVAAEGGPAHRALNDE